jgi:short subunit fatty acids transporter
MSKKYLIYIISILIVIAVVFSIKSYIYKPHEDITKRSVDYEVKAELLIDQLNDQAKIYAEKYNHKMLLVSGQVTELDTNWLILNQKILFKFNQNITKDLKIGDNLKVKARFLGYDELLDEINFDQSMLINDTQNE